MQLRCKNKLTFVNEMKKRIIKKGELYQYQIDMLKRLQNSPRVAFSFGRQMGKTMLQQELIKQYYDIMNSPTYTKTIYLSNGSYIFEIYKNLGTFKLRKIKGKWMATNVWYILKFLDRKGANKKVIAEIEKELFGALT